ncbi:hypothetical protein T484DRAFT_1887776 [Baffinella frigidus]|nr:hypothetical protein T484DRAFT_1887776 [Cryptophyta sp. CCMP2293]
MGRTIVAAEAASGPGAVTWAREWSGVSADSQATPAGPGSPDRLRASGRDSPDRPASGQEKPAPGQKKNAVGGDGPAPGRIGLREWSAISADSQGAGINSGINTGEAGTGPPRGERPGGAGGGPRRTARPGGESEGGRPPALALPAGIPATAGSRGGGGGVVEERWGGNSSISEVVDEERWGGKVVEERWEWGEDGELTPPSSARAFFHARMTPL